MASETNKPVRNAFNEAARQGAIWGAIAAVAALYTGTFVLGAVIVAAVSGYSVASRYERKLEALQQKDAESRRPSEGPGW